MLRQDLNIIQSWIAPHSQVVDLGCGDGQLLDFLKRHKQVQGYGLEIDPDSLTACVRKGLNVIEHNLDNGLSHFKDQSLDTVVMTQALQIMRRPDLMLDEMLRVGREAIITFPNFGHWRTRYYLLCKGRMPMSETLPHAWFDTPNIHMCTFKDFEALCREKNLKVLNRTVVDSQHQERWSTHLWPNLLGEIAIYRVSK